MRQNSFWVLGALSLFLLSSFAIGGNPDRDLDRLLTRKLEIRQKMNDLGKASLKDRQKEVMIDTYQEELDALDLQIVDVKARLKAKEASIQRKSKRIQKNEAAADSKQTDIDWRISDLESMTARYREQIQADPHSVGAAVILNHKNYSVPVGDYEEAKQLVTQVENLQQKQNQQVNRRERAKTSYRKAAGKEFPSATKGNTISVSDKTETETSTETVTPSAHENSEKQRVAACWQTDESPVAEVIPAVFNVGATTLTDAQTKKLEEQIAQTWKMIQAQYPGKKIGRIEAIASSSAIPSRGRSNEDLAEARAETGLAAFSNALSIQPALKSQACVPDFSTQPSKDYVAKDFKKVQGTVWTPAQSAAWKAKKVTDADIDEAYEELKKFKVEGGLNRTSVPYDLKNEEEGKKQLRTDFLGKRLYDLKYQPFQYVKIRIYAASYNPALAGCVNHANVENASVSENHAKDVTPTNPSVPDRHLGADDSVGQPNKAGQVEQQRR